jgi:hypothetical protein
LLQHFYNLSPLDLRVQEGRHKEIAPGCQSPYASSLDAASSQENSVSV